MDRRELLRLLAASPLVSIAGEEKTPAYRIVSGYPAADVPGMPGPYPGRVVAVQSEKCVDPATSAADAEVVREMMARGLSALTGEKTPLAAWRRFFEPGDVVGIKVNCGGHPWVVSSPEIVAECVRQLMAVGIEPSRIYVYERFQNQLDVVDYAPRLPEGVSIVAAETANRRIDNRGYDPATYVEADLFGEEDTRSNMMRLVSRTLTKIINVPNVKDHGATGATGCLKNISYGSFSNVARTHHHGRSHTYSFVGTLATVEPLRSRTVLQIMDGLRGVWHGGPFAPTRRYLFYPKRILFGTDPVAIDRLLLDIVDERRKAEGAISIWDRSPRYLKVDDSAARDQDPNVNIMIREPGHVEYASRLGLGVYDRDRIAVQAVEV
jgi:uncharacterized protein (DUF362 family)